MCCLSIDDLAMRSAVIEGDKVAAILLLCFQNMSDIYIGFLSILTGI